MQSFHLTPYLPYLIIATALVIQLLLILHIIKTGSSPGWIFTILLLPIVGSIIYFLYEIAPRIEWGHFNFSFIQSDYQRLKSEQALTHAACDYFYADSLENTKKLALQCLYQEMYEVSRHLFKNGLSGIYKSEPDMMYGLARSEYGLRNFGACRHVLDSLIAQNPNYKNQDAHLLYAKTLEKLKQFKQAIHEYETLVSYYCGPEPTYRLAMLFKQCGHERKSVQLLQKIISQAKNSGAHYYRNHKNWIKLAQNAL